MTYILNLVKLQTNGDKDKLKAKVNSHHVEGVTHYVTGYLDHNQFTVVVGLNFRNARLYIQTLANKAN